MSQEDKPSETDLELWHRVESEPPGTFKIYHAVGAGVEERIQQHLENRRELKKRIQHCVDSFCFIEVISLRLQVIDYWLRIFFANQAPVGIKRRKEFGAILEQCREMGLSDELHDKLLDFNTDRINAIHGYVVGATSYQALEPVTKNSEGLLKEVVEFVIRNSGTVVTNRDGLCASPGALAIHVERFCENLRNDVFY